MGLIDLAEKGLLPDWLIRLGIRRLLAARLRNEDLGDREHQRAARERHAVIRIVYRSTLRRVTTTGRDQSPSRRDEVSPRASGYLVQRVSHHSV